MACPTCDHTMQSIGEPDGAGQRFWCPRCGTLKTVGQYGGDDIPMLVERCRKFEAAALDADHDPKAVAEWYRLGVEESINTPANRAT